jgi:hypothetical protein
MEANEVKPVGRRPVKDKKSPGIRLITRMIKAERLIIGASLAFYDAGKQNDTQFTLRMEALLGERIQAFGEIMDQIRKKSA